MTARALGGLKDVTQTERVRDRFARWNIQRLLSFSIGIALFGLFLGGCEGLQRRANAEPTATPTRPSDPKPPAGMDQPPRPLSDEVEKALQFSKSPLIGVIAIDQEGRIQLYHSKRAESFRAEFPLKADSIEFMSSMTIFQTSNPKLCIQYMTNLIGQLQCLKYIYVP